MFRFTIRDVLWLTVVVALSVGWWMDRDRLGQRIVARDAHWATRNEGLEFVLRQEGWSVRDDGNRQYASKSGADHYSWPVAP
jgi:hypothetical protein